MNFKKYFRLICQIIGCVSALYQSGYVLFPRALLTGNLFNGQVNDRHIPMVRDDLFFDRFFILPAEMVPVGADVFFEDIQVVLLVLGQKLRQRPFTGFFVRIKSHDRIKQRDQQRKQRAAKQHRIGVAKSISGRIPETIEQEMRDNDRNDPVCQIHNA